MRWVVDEDWVRPGQIRGRAVFDFEDSQERKLWERIEGDIDPVFTTSGRSDFGAQTSHFIGTGESARQSGRADDAQVGVIQSPVFTVDADRYFLVVSGGGDRDRTYVSIVRAEDNKELARVTGTGNSNRFEPLAVDMSKHRGQSVRIRVVDRATDGWRHINLGGVYAD